MNEQQCTVVEDLIKCVQYCEEQHSSSAGEILPDMNQEKFADIYNVIQTLLVD